MNFWKTVGKWITKPLIPILKKSGITPDTLTWLSLGLSVITAVTIAANHLIISGFLVLLAGLCDILDGTLARSTNKTTLFGSLLDSTFDRISEAVLLFGLLVLSIRNEYIIEILLIFGVLVGSFLTSYIRARAEGLGIDCRIGLFTRTERVIILALGLFFNQIFIVLIVLMVFTFFTVGQRLVYVHRQTRRRGNSEQ